jgi:hypothetical protein
VSDTCLTRSRLSDVRLSTQHHTAVGAVEPPLTVKLKMSAAALKGFWSAPPIRGSDELVK